MNNVNRTQELQDRIRSAVNDKTMLQIVGGNSKQFYGNPAQGKVEILETRIHQGVLSYEPSELVITARAGTPLKEIIALLAENNQMLPFEPPCFTEHATLGGAIAAGLSGSRRPFTGSVRDFVLGVRIINGKGEVMSFGGQVMKNVAGYDVSRLMAGAMGTLGLLLDISIKVLPRPQAEHTLCLAMSQAEALDKMHALNRVALPLSAMAYLDEKLYLRLSGAESAVNAASEKIAGESLIHAEQFWQQLNEQSHTFFQTDKPLWRLSVPYVANIELNENSFIDWAGALYWLHSDKPAEEIQQHAKEQGGAATLFRTSDENKERFAPLQAKIKQFHINLKMRFDPYGILNFGRLYPDL